jgi:hypothetical protein
MSNGDLQLIADTLIIESFVKEHQELAKEAGLFDDLGLGSIASHIQSFVKKHFAGESKADVAKNILKIMAPSILFRIYKPLGIIYLIIELAGGSGFVKNILDTIMGGIAPKIEGGKSVSSAEIGSLGMQAVQSIAGPMPSTAANDMLYVLRKPAEEDVRAMSELKSVARRYRPKGLVGSVGWGLGSSKGKSLVERLLGGGRYSKWYRGGGIKWLAGGLVVWIIKNILLGLGLLAAGTAVKGLLTGPDKPEEKKEAPTGEAEIPEDMQVMPVSVKPKILRMMLATYGLFLWLEEMLRICY